MKEVRRLETIKPLSETTLKGWSIKFLLTPYGVGFVFENGRRSVYLPPTAPNKKAILKALPRSLYVTISMRKVIA